ncbi:MAG: hypothetical protein JRI68_13510 [Deltaproteobacteria bacterium]|nr:hypothetical protein [Deltaproteobacteria bacterium]
MFLRSFRSQGSGVCEPGTTAPCYSGPDGTEGVGVCLAGETTCDPDGSGFGPCEGEVVPAAEDCNEPTDEDCDGEVNELDAGCSCTPGELMDCYEGPDGTEGEGICHGGQQMCLPNGESLTLCFGQVVPQLEECTTPDDDDCDGSPNDGCPFWGLRFGAESSNDSASSVAVLDDGSSVIVGYAHQAMDFGGSSLPAGGGSDVVIGKLDSAGTHVWSARYGDGGDSWVGKVAVDGAGDIYLTGSFEGTLDFGGLSTPLVAASAWNGFVAKISAAGVAQWAIRLGDSGATRPRSIDVDANGNAAITGYFEGTLTLTSQASSDAEDGFVARLDGSGAITWGATFGGAGDDRGRDVALEGSNLIVVGHFASTIDFGGTAETDDGGQDGFVAKVNGSNVQQWIVPIGALGDQFVNDVALDGTNVVAIGDGNGNLSILGQETAANMDDVFVVKLDADGSLLWTQHYVGPQDQHTGGIAVDGQGNVWFGVSHEGTVAYGGELVMSEGDDDWVLVKLDSAGVHQRSLRFGDDDDQDVRDMATDSQGNLVVVGECQDRIDFGFGALTGSSTYEDICIARLPQ